MQATDQLPVKNVFKGLLEKEVIALMTRVLSKKYPGNKETIPFWQATLAAKSLQSHSKRGKHSADLRETLDVLYRLQRKHMEEALRNVRVLAEGSSLLAVSDAYVEKLKGVAGLLYAKEVDFLDSVLEQQRLGYSLTTRQLSWLGKIDHRFRNAQKAKQISIPVSGGFR